MPKLPKLAMPARTASNRQQGSTPQDSARRTSSRTSSSRVPTSPQSPGVLYVD